MKFYRTEQAARRLQIVQFDGIIVMRKRTERPNWVAAVFQNAAVSIKVARRTTFAQLAEKLTALADTHGELVRPVRVSIATAPSNTSVYQSSRHVAD